jgi:hypothetical protein
MNPILHKYFHKLLTPPQVQKCVDLKIPGFFVVIGTAERQFLLRTLLGKHLQSKFSPTTLESITAPIQTSLQHYREEKVYWIDSSSEDHLTLTKMKKISDISIILSPSYICYLEGSKETKNYPKFILPYPERLVNSKTLPLLEDRFEVLSLQENYQPSLEFLELIGLPGVV